MPAINRRNFIKLAIGGAVGTGLSPLPWKLMDDTAIFTQNLPWVPVPEEGEVSYVRSFCTLCHGGCGISVKKFGERAVKIEGEKDCPLNRGSLCPLGIGGLQLLYNEQNRFTGPVKRVGPRGTDSFESISWKEAVKILSSRLAELNKRGKQDSVAAIDGNPFESTMSLLIQHLVKSMGSSNYMRVPSMEETGRMVSALIYGKPEATGYDLENADYILSFGSGLLDGWGSAGYVLNTWGLNGSNNSEKAFRLVQIESRLSNSASMADKWIAPLPGTETVLALGLAHVIIKEELYNKTFIDKYGSGFSESKTLEGESLKGFKEYVLENFSTNRVSEITKVKAKDIIFTARDFASASSPLAVCGHGKGLLNGDVAEFMAVNLLNALTGNLNRKGGLYNKKSLPLAPFAEEGAGQGSTAGIQDEKSDFLFSTIDPLQKGLSGRLLQKMLKDSGSEVDTLLIFSSNPAYTLPDGGDFRKAMSSIPFVVSFSPYRDESSLMADLVLPDHSYLEKRDEIVSPSTFHFPSYGLTAPVMAPLYNTKNSGDVILSIAEKTGGTVAEAFPWKDYESVLKLRIKGIAETDAGPDSMNPDRLFKKLKSGDLWYSNNLSDNSGSNEKLSGQDLQVRFFGSDMEKIFRISLSSHRHGPGTEETDQRLTTAQSATDSDDSGFPLRMLPYELINLSSGWVPNPPYLNKTIYDNQLFKNDSFVEINPLTAREYGLQQGDRVRIESVKGSLQVRVHLFEGAMPGTVFMPMGFGHTAYDDFTRGKGVSPNDIMAGGYDPITGHSMWWNTFVRLIKV